MSDHLVTGAVLIAERVVTCDRCGVAANCETTQANGPAYMPGVRFPDGALLCVTSWATPENWDRFNGLDLCPACLPILRSLLMGWEKHPDVDDA